MVQCMYLDGFSFSFGFLFVTMLTHFMGCVCKRLLPGGFVIQQTSSSTTAASGSFTQTFMQQNLIINKYSNVQSAPLPSRCVIESEIHKSYITKWLYSNEDVKYNKTVNI